ncbi:MAG TPA: EamA family transporter [Candidatus Sulfotelmatobacter sp.]|nr:EamA family transporter [Candidatus Sulfotelmatobacter sp.]
MDASSHPAKWKVLLAFGIIYFVWGSTFLAIRVGVREVPPFFLAGMRFLIAGLALYAWLRVKGTPSPTRREWGSATLLAVLIFVLDYGLLFWAEQKVPSGIAAVMMATIPAFMAIADILILKSERLTGKLALGLIGGIAGVAVLVSHSANFGDTPIDPIGATALIISAISWSIASALTRKLPLPTTKAMSSGAQMLAGGVLLMITAGTLGEFRGFHLQAVSGKAWLALAYLIVAGSIVGFTAYVWLLHHESPTKVGTYAYVNPIVAVIVGYLLGGEALGARTVLGTLLVLASILVITITPRRKSAPEISHVQAQTSFETEN